jgi:TRAP-type mannitol/chloroaromatic compound transport system permease large subunit
MQTSFMHPPFGFALFYLRGVAPKTDFVDRITGKLTEKVSTGQIYWGAVPFVCIQVIMVALVIAFPGLVLSGVSKGTGVDPNKVQILVPDSSYEDTAPIQIK